MTKNNSVYLLVGPRGSGKSQYGIKLHESHSDLSVISRDEIIRRLCGTEHPDSYSGGIEIATDIMHRLLRRKLSTKTTISIVLDCWTGGSHERKALIRKLHEYGATRIVALYFVTPVEYVKVWFWQKPGVAPMSEMGARQGETRLVYFAENTPERDYRIFHRLASRIQTDGFDEVIQVNPLEPLIAL
jgi:predicted kinase